MGRQKRLDRLADADVTKKRQVDVTRVASLIACYIKHDGSRISSAVRDALADLMHMAHSMDLDWVGIIDGAYEIFDLERGYHDTLAKRNRKRKSGK